LTGYRQSETTEPRTLCVDVIVEPPFGPLRYAAVIFRAPRDEEAARTAVASFNRHHFRQLSISIR
jgi:hypothetical protein